MKDIRQKKINQCRVCLSEDLKTVLTLPKMPFTDQFVQKSTIGKEFLGDIEIGICNCCGSVQNMNNTDMDDYYNDYTYTVQSSSFAREFMRKFAENIKNRYLQGIPSPRVLEIGSGSGEQLYEFQKLGCDVLGIEPSEKLSDYANSIGVKTLTAFFDENTELDSNSFDLIISSYTFDHVPQPKSVLDNIRRILKDTGFVATEVHDLNLIKERNEFCLFEHEHYIYLNHCTFKNLLDSTGFELITYDLLEQSEKRANSLISIARKKQGDKPYSFSLIENEVKEIESLSKNIYNSIDNFENWLKQHSDKVIVAYGAGGRGVMTIAALQNSDKLSYIVDKNPKAQDIYSPKSHIPIYPITKLKDDSADIIIIFSFGYYQEIVDELVAEFGYKESQFISILDILNK